MTDIPKSNSDFKSQWDERVSIVAARRDAIDALPGEVRELLSAVHSRSIRSGSIDDYFWVRAECLRIWGKKDAGATE